MNSTLSEIGTKQLDFSKNKIQQEFLKCNARFQNFSGGFGSGKTTACCFKSQLVSALMPNNMGVIARSTYPDLRDTTRKVFIEILNPSWYKYWKESENAMTFKNNSTILFRHFETGKIKVGASLGWFFIDQAEEATEEIFKGLVGRLRREVPRRYGFLAMNPNGQDWQYRLFVKERNPNYAHFDSTTFDNEGNLPDGYIEDMVQNYSQEWIDRYVYGKWNQMSGLIFHEYDDSRHLVDPFEIDKSWAKARGNDWGVDAPTTCMFVARSPDGKYYVFDEYGDTEKTPEEHADAINQQSKQYGAFRGSVLDSSAFHRESDLKSIASRYTTRGYFCQPATKDVLASIATVKNLLKTNRLFFFRGKTQRTIAEMKVWRWGPKKNGREAPTAGNDHFLDGLRYVLYWMERKNFGSSQSVSKQRERIGGRLSIDREATSDPVTGLPA